MSEILNVARSDDEEMAESTDTGNEQEVAESTDTGNEQEVAEFTDTCNEQEVAESTDTGNEQNEGRQRLSKEDRRIQREMARVKLETIGPVNWDVDKIFQGLEKPRDVTAAVLKVLAGHNFIHRQRTLRRYKAALAHCINAKPTRIPGVRTYKPGKPTLEGLSCLPTTEYDYKILQASKFFRIKVTTLNNLLIELEALVPSKNTPPLLEPAERAESECSNDEEDATKERSEEEELPNLPVETEEDSETEAEIEKMPTIVRQDEYDGTESADEPVEEAVWDRPMDEVTTFGGDYLDKTKSKEERLRSFVSQVMYHVKDDDDRQCVEWMIKAMLDPSSFATIPSIYEKSKVLEYYKLILPSLHMSEDFYPVAVDFAPLCGTRTIRFKRGGGFQCKEEPGVRQNVIDDEEEDDIHWKIIAEEARKEREEYAEERARRREDGVPSDSDDWPESDEDARKEGDEDEEVDVDVDVVGIESTTEDVTMMGIDRATEDSTTESRETTYTDDVTSDGREETPGDADDEGSSEQQYHSYDDGEDDEDTVEEGDYGDDDDVQCLGDVKALEKPAREEENGEDEDVDVVGDDDDVVEVEKEEKMEIMKEDEVEVDVITLDDDDNVEITPVPSMIPTLHLEEDVYPEEEEEDDDDDDEASDYHSVASRPCDEAIEGNPTVSVPVAHLIAPSLPSDGAEEEGDLYASLMEEREKSEGARAATGGGGILAMNATRSDHAEEEEDNDVTLIETPPTANDDDSRDDSPASPEPEKFSYGDDNDDEVADDDHTYALSARDDHDYVQDDHDYARPAQRARSPAHKPIEIAQPPTPQEPERKRRKVNEDEEEEKEKEEEPMRRRSMRGKAPTPMTPILPPKTNSRKKKEEKVIERVVKKEEVDEDEEALTTTKRGRGRPKGVRSILREMWNTAMPTAAKDKKSEETKQMEGNQEGASEKEPTTTVQQLTRGRKRMLEVMREMKLEVKEEVPDEDDEVSVVASVSSRKSARGRTPRGRTPAKQKATTPVPAKDKKSAAQKLRETLENAKLIMSMNKDFNGSKPTTPDQSVSKRTRGSMVKKEVVDEDDEVAIVAVASSGGASRRSARSRGRPPTKHMPWTPDEPVSKRRGEREIKIEVEQEVPDAEDVQSNTVSSQRKPRGRTPRAKTPVGKQKAPSPVEPKNKRNKEEEAAGKKVEVKQEMADADYEPSTTVSSQRKPRGRTPRAKTPVGKQKAPSPVEPKNKRNKEEETAGKNVEVKKELPDGNDEDVKIIATVRKPRGRTPAKLKATTPVAVRGGNKGSKQVDLMSLVSTAESRSKPSTPEMARIKGSADEGLSERKRSLRGHKEEAKKAVEPEVIEVEDDEEEKGEEASKQPADRRRSLRGGTQAAKSPMKSKKIEQKKEREAMEVMKSKEEQAKTDDKPVPKKPPTRKSGPVASFTMPPAQPRRRSQK